MKKIILLLLFSGFVFNVAIAATVPAPSNARQIAAQNIYDILDDFFVRQYGDNNKAIAQLTRPVLIVDGFNYLLLEKKGTLKFNGLAKPFSELKAVAHIGPALYAIGVPVWKDPKDETWKRNLVHYRTLVKNALNVVDNVDWSNPAWYGKTKRLREFMRSSLSSAVTFINDVLKKGSYTKKDYERFSTHYMRAMVVAMYMADVANTTATLAKLKEWKRVMGTSKWAHLYVLVMGSKGRTTAGLTLNTNTAAYTVASLMTPQHARTHMIIIPAAKDLEQALNSLGAVINARQLASLTFTSRASQHVSGLYAALRKPTVPLAMQNVKSIITQYLRVGKIKLPKF